MASITRPAPRRSRRIAASLGLIALAASVVAVGSSSASANKDHLRKPKTVEVQLLAFNDYHGHLEANTPGTVNGAPAGGAEYLATKLSQLRAGHRNTLTVAAGDLIGGTPFLSGLFRDEPSVESLNAMGLDVSSVGNHEFDDGLTELLRMQHGGCHPVDGCFFPDDPYEGADFKWLAANVVNERGRPVLPPVWVKSFQGVKVGFIGMTLEDTPTLVAASGIVGLDFLDEVETANNYATWLKRSGVETIVVLLHEGGAQVSPDVNACEGISGPVLAINGGLDPEIDVMVTGHTHQPYNCLLPDAAGQMRRVTSAFSFGRVVSEINLVIDKRTGEVDRTASTATNHVVTQDVPKDPEQTAILAKWQPLSAVVGNRPVGEITATITRGSTNGSEDRGIESSAGNFVADAQLWATQFNGAEVALMNPGGLRSDLTYPSSPAGEGDGVVTYGEAFTFQPFGNLLVTIPLTGDQLLRALNQQCQPSRPQGQSRPFLHLGVSDGVTYDMTYTITTSTFTDPVTGVQTQVRNCTSIGITNVLINGAALDLGATYQVTINNFLADGGDNFTVFREVPVADRVGGGVDLDAVNAYLGTEGPIDPPPANRVTVTPVFVTV